jgi:beta-N-acetylhexosaminidase
VATKSNPNTLAAKVGRLFVIGFEDPELSVQTRSMLTKIQPAGVVLFGRNINSANQTHQLLKDCQALVSSPLFTCVDVEGGRVDRFRNVNGGTPSAADVFSTGNKKLCREHGKVIGEFCRALGFNTDFAPVLDLALEASRSVMSSRAVSPDPRQTIAYGKQFLSGLREVGVLGCGKHFPGLGEGNLDSHLQLPVIAKSFKKLWDEDMVPYRLLRRQLPFVLISHAGYPGITGDNTPATLSKKLITNVLRRRIGYTGLVISDDMEMGAVLNTVSVEEAAIAHIEAGGDLCLICRTEELILRAHEAVRKEVETSAAFARRVRVAATRVEKLKKKLFYSIRWKFPPAPTQRKIDRLSLQLRQFVENVRLENMRASQEKS